MGIFEELAEEFGIGPDSPESRLAQDLAAADEEFMRQLVELRHAAGLTQEALGRAWGRHKTAVSQFERPGADPRLSTIRRYAASIGARYFHYVTLDPACRRSHMPLADLHQMLEHWGDDAPTPQELTGPIQLIDLTGHIMDTYGTDDPKQVISGQRRMIRDQGRSIGAPGRHDRT